MGGRQWRRVIAATLFLSAVPQSGAQSPYGPVPAPALPDTTAASGWTITPDITVSETYNDNPRLAPSGGERHDFITQVTPGLRIDGRGPRLRGYFDYRPSALLYARNSSDSRLINRLSSFATVEAIDNFFFLDVNGQVTQNFISPFGARPVDLSIDTSNRTETRSFGLSPYVRGMLGRGYGYELRNRNTWTRTDTSLIGNVHSQEWTGRLASPVTRFGWALEYEDRKVDQERFTVQRDLETRLARGRLFYQPDYAWRFSFSAGREENNYRSFSEMDSFSIRGAGVTFTPSARTSADLQYERRFFGPYRLARLTHRTRLTAWNIRYLRSASDFQQEVLRLPPGFTLPLIDAIFAARIPDPVERANAILQFYGASGTPLFLSEPLAFYTQQIFLQERLEASAGIIGVRNSITFSVFASDGTRLTEGLSGVLPDAFLLGRRIKQKGFGIRMDHKVTPSTTAGVSATRTQSEQLDPSTVDSWNNFLAFTLNHRVSPKTTTFAGVSRSGFKTQAVTVTDRTAHTAFVGLRHRF
jgi:uncharacterized protein (PEP-CTERM system associated)